MRVGELRKRECKQVSWVAFECAERLHLFLPPMHPCAMFAHSKEICMSQAPHGLEMFRHQTE